MWKVVFAKHAAKDAKRLKSAGLDKKAKDLIRVIGESPFASPPPYEGLVGNLSGLYSRRITLQHRFVYEANEGGFEEGGIEYEGVVKVLRMWTQYEGL